MKHVETVPASESVCAGCNACEIVCALVHEGETGPSLKRIFVETSTILMEHKIHTCQQCDDKPCYHKCPKKDAAMCFDEEKGIVYINEEFCLGCRQCIKACPFEPKRINYDKGSKKSKKCDLCRTRENGPACIEYCQVLCLKMSET